MTESQARLALQEEIDLLKVLQQAATTFTASRQNPFRILRGWNGTFVVLIEELEELLALPDDQLKARLQEEVELNDAFLELVSSKCDHPDAESWQRFFEEENEISEELQSYL